MPSTIFTLGYQGLTLDEYIALLKEQPITEVIDVRAVAWSRKPGFSKGIMQHGLEAKGINYLHLQEAGNPFRKEESENILEKYKAYLRSNQQSLEVIEAEISNAAKQKKSVCLTCFEKEPQDCHRSIIAEVLLERDPRLHVVHLGKRSNQLIL